MAFAGLILTSLGKHLLGVLGFFPSLGLKVFHLQMVLADFFFLFFSLQPGERQVAPGAPNPGRTEPAKEGTPNSANLTHTINPTGSQLL